MSNDKSTKPVTQPTITPRPAETGRIVENSYDGPSKTMQRPSRPSQQITQPKRGK